MVTQASVKATFFGTTSLYLSDGTTSIFTDAFLTRPALYKVALSSISPDIKLIRDTLERGDVHRTDAIFVAHSHFDHAMDAPEVINQIGGKLYGSQSTINIGKGAGLATDSMQVIQDGEEYSIGAFKVRVFIGKHSPGNKYPGTIDGELKPPAKAKAYKDGGCFSFYITHPSCRILIHPSANFVAGKFKGLEPDLLYLGIGVLGAQSEQFQEDYWRETVETTRPKLIIPIHWDNFGKPLTEPLQPLPRLLDNFENTRKLLDRKCQEGGWKIQWQQAFETIDCAVVST